VLKL
jgi:GTPase SAR1 family protein